MNDTATLDFHGLDSNRANDLRHIQRVYKLPPVLARLLFELIQNQLMSSDELMAAGVNTPQSAIQRLRKSLGLTIHVRRMTGYWLDDADKERLRGELQS